AQPEMFRVAVRDRQFSWLRKYRAFVVPNPKAEREGIAGYELGLTFNGLVIRLVPRAESELSSKARISIVSVNEAEHRVHPCGHFVTKRGAVWTLLPNGERLLNLLTF